MNKKEKNNQISEGQTQEENAASTKEEKKKVEKKSTEKKESKKDKKPKKLSKDQNAKIESETIKKTKPVSKEKTRKKVVKAKSEPVIEASSETEEIPKKEEIAESSVDNESEDVKKNKPTEDLEIAIPNDDEEDEESHDEHEVQSYEEKSRKELASLLEEVVEEGEIDEIKKRVALIKVAFLKKEKEIVHDEEDKAEEANELDPITEKFNIAFGKYRQKHKKYLQELEIQKENNLERKKIILEELKLLVESEQPLKETYDKFKDLQEKWKEIGMVPKKEVQDLWQTYHFNIERFFEKIKISKELKDLDLKKNLEAKVDLCEKAEELLLEKSAIVAFKKLQEYHISWKEVGPVPGEKREEIWERFKATTEKIHEKRRAHYENIEEQFESNYAAKIALCEKIEAYLVDSKNETFNQWNEATKKINEIFKEWRSIGRVPQKHNDAIWKRFKNSIDTFFSAKKEYFNGIKEEQNNNYNLKVDLCLQAEAIQDSADWKDGTRRLIALQGEWKKIGPVSRRQSDKIWKRFRAACDTFFNRKSEYFSKRGEVEAENLKEKEALIKTIKEYVFGDDNTENLEVIKRIQRQWNEIGHVPFAHKDRLYKEFRKEIDVQLDKLNINKKEMATMKFKAKVDRMKESDNSWRQVSSERNFLMSKKKQMEDDVLLWENNLGFFAQSKQADLLKMEFEKKIQKAKKEIEMLDVKIKYLDR